VTATLQQMIAATPDAGGPDVDAQVKAACQPE